MLPNQSACMPSHSAMLVNQFALLLAIPQCC
jgi:hypothetical protein